MAQEKLSVSQTKMKRLYDHRSEHHEYSLADQVLLLMPIVGSSFQAMFSGPYAVAEKVSDLNYLVSMPGRRKAKRLFHINLLKPYYSRGEDAASGQGSGNGVRPVLAVTSEGVTHKGDGVLELDASLLCRQ